MLRLVEAGEGFGLGVNQRQFGRQFLEHRDRGRLVIHEDAPFAVGQDFSAQDNLGALGVDAVFFQNGLGAGGGLEHAGNRGFVGAVPDDVGGGLAAHQQGERVDQDGFAGAGFAGEEIEPRAEDGDGVVDDGVILGSELDEHRWSGLSQLASIPGPQPPRRRKPVAGDSGIGDPGAPSMGDSERSIARRARIRARLRPYRRRESIREITARRNIAGRYAPVE